MNPHVSNTGRPGHHTDGLEHPHDSRRRGADRARSAGFAAALTLLLHTPLAVLPLLHRGDARSHPQPAPASLAFVGLLTPARADRRVQAMLHLVAAAAPIPVIETPILPQLEAADESAAEVPAPGFVHRIAEITARIQRAWLLPDVRRIRNFHCRIRLDQDEAGALRPIALQECDDDAELRASLLKSIRAAAPLPVLEADPRGERGLTLDFDAFATLTAGRRSSVQPSASVPR